MGLGEDFWSRVMLSSDGCWIWTGGHVGKGYGAYYLGPGLQRPAHRVAYEAYVGSVDQDLDLDHLCRNRSCVNYLHLEPTTRRENLLRSPITLTAMKAAQTECIHGHEFTPRNTRIAKNGTRHCRKCDSRRAQEYKQRIRLKAVI